MIVNFFRKLKSSFSFPENRAIFLIGILILIFFTSLNWNAWAKDAFKGKETDQLVPPWENNLNANKEIDKVARLPLIKAKKTASVKKNTTVSNTSKNITGPAVFIGTYDYHSEIDLKNEIAEAKESGMKTIFFQARDVADAYYRSTYEPWAEGLSGTLGRDPGWDPLSVAISETHKRGMKLYAWMNLYTVWRGETAPKLNSHLYYQHKNWFAYEKDKGKMKLNPGYLYLSPGNPEVNNYLTKVCLDLASRYRVDGLLLDQIAYPNQYYSYDSISLNRFRAQKDLNWNEWRVVQVSNLVKQIKEKITDKGLKMKLGAAVYGRYPEGKSNFGQDSVYWVKHNWVSFIAPLIEWDLHGSPRFDLQVDDFKNRVGAKRLCVGISAYQFASNFSELTNQIKTVQKDNLTNFAFYTYRHLNGRWGMIKNLIKE